MFSKNNKCIKEQLLLILCISSHLCNLFTMTVFLHAHNPFSYIVQYLQFAALNGAVLCLLIRHILTLFPQSFKHNVMM